jgi:hypothetical protein
MPCDQIVFQSVDFAMAKGHEDLLSDALRDRGYTVTNSNGVIIFRKGYVSGTYSGGKFTHNGSDDFDVDGIKKSFATRVVHKAAKKYGWAVVEKGGKMQLRKRV